MRNAGPSRPTAAAKSNILHSLRSGGKTIIRVTVPSYDTIIEVALGNMPKILSPLPFALCYEASGKGFCYYDRSQTVLLTRASFFLKRPSCSPRKNSLQSQSIIRHQSIELYVLSYAYEWRLAIVPWQSFYKISALALDPNLTSEWNLQ